MSRMLAWCVREHADSDAEGEAKKTPISGPADAARLLGPLLRVQTREVFVLLALDTRGRAGEPRLVSMGSLSASIVHPREVFREAIAAEASSIIVAHNHPSGDATPSPEDIAVTRKLVAAGEILGIPVLDHLIFGKVFTSLRDIGIFCPETDVGIPGANFYRGRPRK